MWHRTHQNLRGKVVSQGLATQNKEEVIVIFNFLKDSRSLRVEVFPHFDLFLKITFSLF